VRLVGTAAACVALAFGAAFLVGRAVSHQPSKHTPAAALRLASATVSSKTSSDPALAAQFTPGLSALKRIAPRRHVKKHHNVKPNVSPAAPTASTPSGTTPTTTSDMPLYVPPAQSSSPSSHKPSGQGSGTTSVGGSKKKSGTGTTSVG
jgi:hypothetical protein